MYAYFLMMMHKYKLNLAVISIIYGCHCVLYCVYCVYYGGFTVTESNFLSAFTDPYSCPLSLITLSISFHKNSEDFSFQENKKW